MGSKETVKVWHLMDGDIDLYVTDFKLGATGYVHDHKKHKFYLATVGYVKKWPPYLYNEEPSPKIKYTDCDYRGRFHFGETYRIGLNIVKPIRTTSVNLETSGFCVWH